MQTKINYAKNRLSRFFWKRGPYACIQSLSCAMSPPFKKNRLYNATLKTTLESMVQARYTRKPKRICRSRPLKRRLLAKESLSRWCLTITSLFKILQRRKEIRLQALVEAHLPLLHSFSSLKSVRKSQCTPFLSMEKRLIGLMKKTTNLIQLMTARLLKTKNRSSKMRQVEAIKPSNDPRGS